MKLAGGRAGVAAGLLIVEQQSSSVSQAVAASQGCVFGQKTHLLQNTVGGLGDAEGSKLHS